MAVGYVPLLIALYATIRMQWQDVRPAFRHLMTATGIFSALALAVLVSWCRIFSVCCQGAG
jgi:hypothetical protein